MERLENPFDQSLLYEHSEAGVRGLVSKLPEDELHGCRASLISRAVPRLRIRMPTYSWMEATWQVRQITEGEWEVFMTVPIDDPCCVAWSINWPGPVGRFDYDADWESGRMTVAQRSFSPTENGAREDFKSSLACFHAHLESAAADVERYNAALPYLISIWVEARLDGLNVGVNKEERKTDPWAREQYREALDQLVAEGKIVFVEEIDPQTGKLRKRYFHADQAPKPN